MGISLKVFMTLPMILLQKPSASSKAKDHSQALSRRIKWLKDGELQRLLSECRSIQRQLRPKTTWDNMSKAFAKLIMMGNVNAALRLLSEESDGCVLLLSEEVLRNLQEKHPAPADIQPSSLLYGPVTDLRNLSIAVDEQTMLCSKQFHREGKCLRSPARLFIVGGGELQLQEGTTQGDPLAMPFYAISVMVLISFLHDAYDIVKQVWFADDSTAAGKLCALLIIKDPPVVDRFISDHASILCNLQQAKPALTIVSRTYRKIKFVNLALEADLAMSGLCRDSLEEYDLDELVRKYDNVLSDVTERHAPLKTKRMVARPAVPWYNEEIDIAKRLRRKAERKWRRSKSVVDFTHFKQKRNQVMYIMNQAKRKFYADFIEENKADQGQLFKAAKKLLGKKEELSFPDHFEQVSLANDIGGFFVKKIENIRSDTNAVQFDLDVVPQDLVLSETQTFGDFQQLTEEDVTALVQKSGKKLGVHRIWNFQIRPEPDLPDSHKNSGRNSGRICRI